MKAVFQPSYNLLSPLNTGIETRLSWFHISLPSEGVERLSAPLFAGNFLVSGALNSDCFKSWRSSSSNKRLRYWRRNSSKSSFWRAISCSRLTCSSRTSFSTLFRTTLSSIRRRRVFSDASVAKLDNSSLGFSKYSWALSWASEKSASNLSISSVSFFRFSFSLELKYSWDNSSIVDIVHSCTSQSFWQTALTSRRLG